MEKNMTQLKTNILIRVNLSELQRFRQFQSQLFFAHPLVTWSIILIEHIEMQQEIMITRYINMIMLSKLGCLPNFWKINMKSVKKSHLFCFW